LHAVCIKQVDPQQLHSCVIQGEAKNQGLSGRSTCFHCHRGAVDERALRFPPVLLLQVSANSFDAFGNIALYAFKVCFGCASLCVESGYDSSQRCDNCEDKCQACNEIHGHFIIATNLGRQEMPLVPGIRQAPTPLCPLLSALAGTYDDEILRSGSANTYGSFTGGLDRDSVEGQ